MNTKILSSVLCREFGMSDLEEGIEIARNEDAGICLMCHSVQYGCEPDARLYECEDCGEHLVFGIEEIMMMVIS